eukprot:IDg11781t1
MPLVEKYADNPGIADWNLVECVRERRGPYILITGVPSSLNISAAIEKSMNRPLKGYKLRNITEMFESYVQQDRWRVQLKLGLQALRIGEGADDIEKLGRSARTHIPTALKFADRLSDEQLAKKLCKESDYGVKTMPRQNRSRASQDRAPA